MASDLSSSGVRVQVTPDRLVADLIIPPDVDPALAIESELNELVRGYGVAINEDIQARLAEIASAMRAGQVGCQTTITDVRAEVTGIAWEPSFDPLARDESDDAGEATVDHYARSELTVVAPGDRVGVQRPPTRSTDVTGATINDDRRVEPDPEMFRVTDDGAIIAQSSGLLKVEAQKLIVSDMLSIPEYVDFSTGNIDHQGSVLVEEGVRDRFVVSARDDVIVRGLVEAATINAGRHFTCLRGMAAKQTGTIKVGANATVGYLNNVTGLVGGCLNVQRELMNCDLRVGGALQSPGGDIIGGRVEVTGKVIVRGIGSAAGVPTSLVVGGGRPASPLVVRLSELLERLRAEIIQREQAYQVNLSILSKMGHDQREKLTIESFDIFETKERFAAYETRHDTLVEAESQPAPVDVMVGRRINANARIQAGDICMQFDREISGPIYITQDDQGALIYSERGGGTFRPIEKIARRVDPGTEAAA